MRDLLYLAGGTGLGVVAALIAAPAPAVQSCGVYKLKHKTAVSYVLRPPPPIEHMVIVKEKCPVPDMLTKPEKTNTSEERVDGTNMSERPRRHKRHRVRRYWR